MRDDENPGTSKIISLHAKEFMRRFLLHVLPKAYVRIRHFGILGNRYKKIKIELIRKIENLINTVKESFKIEWKDLVQKLTGIDVEQCPSCEPGRLVILKTIDSQLNTS